MSGISFLADTNAFIYLLEDKFNYPQLLENNWAFSYITEIELLSKKDITSEQDSIIKGLFESCFRISHNQFLTEKAIYIRKSYALKLPDAIIAASSIVSGLPLISADKQFEKIKELDLILIEP
jgi:predicted nucleic acid-binding protein